MILNSAINFFKVIVLLFLYILFSQCDFWFLLYDSLPSLDNHVQKLLECSDKYSIYSTSSINSCHSKLKLPKVILPLLIELLSSNKGQFRPSPLNITFYFNYILVMVWKFLWSSINIPKVILNLECKMQFLSHYITIVIIIN